MGIRFACHHCNHAMHVKDFQAGKRGRCPVCKQSFRIPLADATHSLDPNRPAEKMQVKAQPASTPTSAHPSAHQEQDLAAPIDTPSRPPMPVAENATPSAFLNSPGAKWFVRPPSGGEYGPATEELLTVWIKEKRVTEDSLLWCQGQSDWIRADILLPELYGSAPPAPPPSTAPVHTPPKPGELESLQAINNRQNAPRSSGTPKAAGDGPPELKNTGRAKAPARLERSATSKASNSQPATSSAAPAPASWDVEVPFEDSDSTVGFPDFAPFESPAKPGTTRQSTPSATLAEKMPPGSAAVLTGQKRLKEKNNQAFVILILAVISFALLCGLLAVLFWPSSRSRSPNPPPTSTPNSVSPTNPPANSPTQMQTEQPPAARSTEDPNSDPFNTNPPQGSDPSSTPGASLSTDGESGSDNADSTNDSLFGDDLPDFGVLPSDPSTTEPLMDSDPAPTTSGAFGEGANGETTPALDEIEFPF